jgi:hypothetical protein
VSYTHRGRYWDRTSDLLGVNEPRFRCANRPEKNLSPGYSRSGLLADLAGMDRELVIRYLTGLTGLALAAGDDGWCPDLAERARRDLNPHPSDP